MMIEHALQLAALERDSERERGRARVPDAPVGPGADVSLIGVGSALVRSPTAQRAIADEQPW
jgi:hypothetical protein